MTSLDIPPNRKLGTLCVRGHEWQSTGKSLQTLDGHCVVCNRLKARRYYNDNKARTFAIVARWQERNPGKVKRYKQTSYRNRRDRLRREAIAQINPLVTEVLAREQPD